MARILRTPQADTDLFRIWDFIADDNLSAADRLIRKMDETFQLLATNPGMGTKQDQYRPGLRCFPVGNYIIFYRPIDDGIEIYRVLHGARQLDDLL